MPSNSRSRQLCKQGALNAGVPRRVVRVQLLPKVRHVGTKRVNAHARSRPVRAHVAAVVLLHAQLLQKLKCSRRRCALNVHLQPLKHMVMTMTANAGFQGTTLYLLTCTH